MQFVTEGRDADTGTGVLSSLAGPHLHPHQTAPLYIQAPFRRHGHNNSLGLGTRPSLPCVYEASTTTFDCDLDPHNNNNNNTNDFGVLERSQEHQQPHLRSQLQPPEPIALTHSFAHEGPQRAQIISRDSSYRPGHRPTRSLGTVAVPPRLLPTPPLLIRQARSFAHTHTHASTSVYGQTSQVQVQLNQDKPLPLLPPSPQSPVPTLSETKPGPVEDMSMSVGIIGTPVTPHLEFKRGGAKSDMKMMMPRGKEDPYPNTISIEIANANGRIERADVSSGSWLDGYEEPVEMEEHERDSVLTSTDGPFDFDDYLPPTRPKTAPLPSNTAERTQRQTRALPFTPQAIDHIRDQLESLSNRNRARTSSFRSADPTMSSFTPPQSTMTQAETVPKGGLGGGVGGGLTRPGSEGEALSFEGSLAHSFARQQKVVDPSSFPDPYPHGLSYHQQVPGGTPTLSSAGSSSTRSSAYTNAGSTISGSGYSGDYSHVRVASGDDFDGASGGMMGAHAGIGIVGVTGVTGGASDGVNVSVIEKLAARTSTGSSVSRKSHGYHGVAPSHASSHTPHVHQHQQQAGMTNQTIPRMRRAHTLHSQSQSHSHPEEFNLPPMLTERPLRSQPSYDTSWQRDHDDFGTSEDEYDYGHPEEEDEDEAEYDAAAAAAGEEDGDEEHQPASAISVVEEGRGLIVHGEGVPVHTLKIQPGITHLLVGGSSTPNSVPAFLTTMLPQISSTLLALDISANFLVSLSPALASCANLEELNISANPLRALPEFLAHLTSLRLLLADSTGISTLPVTLSALQKLHTLSMRRNKMHALPSWLCTLPCLESLLVDGNPFQGPWKALVEPLLAKAPMTPAYPPSTPMNMIAPPSATPISATNLTSLETSDVSDTEDYTDQDETNQSSVPPSAPATTTSSLAVPASSGEDHFEEDTITPAHAHLLGRSATSPSLLGASSPPPQAQPLSRTRTAPNRAYYERVKQSRTEQELTGLSSPSLVALAQVEEDATDSGSPSPMGNPHRDLRRMRSADELRRVMSPAGGGGGVAHPAAPFLSPPASPPRPAIRHLATDSASVISAGSEVGTGASLQRRFASLNIHARSSSRASVRPLASNIFNAPSMLTPREEEGDEGVEIQPATSSRARSATTVSTVSITVGTRDKDYARQQIRQSLAKPRQEKVKDKEKLTGRKWGFLKKMSMGKLRSVEGASGRSTTSVVPTRPSTSSGISQSSLGRGPTLASGSSVSVTPRQLSPPQVEIALPPPSNSITASSATGSGSSAPSTAAAASSLVATNLLRNNSSTDKLKLSSPTTPSSAGLLAPPSSMAKTGKRRSFLPVDGPPALNIPIPNTSSFLGGITATNGSEDDDGTRLHSPGHVTTVDSPLDMRGQGDERHREANARALRSVMAYLRDMNDLTLLSQGNSLTSMYGVGGGVGSASLMDRTRRATVADSQHGMLPSEQSMDSMDSASSAPTTASSSHLRSLDSFNANRSGSLNTMSVATSDSSGSGSGGFEERKAKDDRGKRLMIVREIVETERTYVKNLQELVDIYVRPAAAPVNSIGNVGSSSKESVVPAAERKIVFGGLEALYTFHKESFFPALEAAAKPLLSPQGAAADADSDGKLSSEIAMAVGRTFIAHAAFMKMYSTYINNFDNSVSRIRQWISDRPGPNGAGGGGGSLTPSASTTQLANMGLAMTALATNSSAHDSGSGKANLTSSQRKRIKHYLKRCRMNPRHSQLNLEGYLLLPVQRIPRYRLLLEDLTRSTPPPESYDDPLDRALAEISSLATNMNEGKREAESRKKLVMWQSRIRGKFPSPLVQPHRRMIMDGKLLLTRIVRKQTMAFEVLDSHGDASSVAVDCLAPELTPRPLYGILCNDLFVLCRDPSNGQDPNSMVDLWAVLRMQTMPQPTSIVHGNTLRIVDSKAILYLEAPSTSDALTWFRAINMQVPAQKLDT